MASDLKPRLIEPVNVVEGPGITIAEYFGHVASTDGTVSLAIAKVKSADKAGFQAPEFAEYVICNEGAIEFVLSDSTSIRIGKGEGVFLPKGLRVKWTWPEATTYTVVCLPAFSPELSGTEVDDPGCTVVDTESRTKLAKLHHAAEPKPSATGSGKEEVGTLDKPMVVHPMNVVEAPGITITEYFGHVASKDGTASLATAVVKSASEEAYQTPLFDEYVICVEGSIKFVYGEGEVLCVAAGQGVFLPKGLRVKWIWLEATKYTVLCIPAFSPDLSGREAEEGTTVAKDSASMQKLESLHKEAQSLDPQGGNSRAHKNVMPTMSTMQKVGGNLASACCLLSTDAVVTLLSKSAQKVVDLVDRACDSGRNTVRQKVAFHEQRYSTAPVYVTKAYVSENGKGTYEELDVDACMGNSTFPIKPSELINKAKEIMAMEFGTKEGCDASEYLADDFQFVAPIIGPLGKEEFLRAFGSFKIKDAVPDLKDNAWFKVDPLEPNRVWFMSRSTGTHTGPLNFGAKPIQATGKDIRMPPQAQSMLFDKDGRCYTLTVGYCMDKRIGNTDGLGGMFGIVKATGNALPFPEAQRLYNPSLRFEGFEHIAKAIEAMGYDPNTMKPLSVNQK